MVRGQDKDNPVLLFLHGGPGLPYTGLRKLFPDELEAHFTVVYHTQRAAGRSNMGDIEDMTLAQHVADALTLTDVLLERFGKDKVYLLGHSWGTELGRQVAEAAPENYHAYISVGTALYTDVAEECEAFVQAGLAQLTLDEAAELEGTLESERDFWEGVWTTGNCSNFWSASFGGELYGETRQTTDVFLPTILRAPEYRPIDIYNFATKLDKDHNYALFEDADANARNIGTDVDTLELPVYFFLGRHDHTTVSSIVPDFVEALSAPTKEIIWF